MYLSHRKKIHIYTNISPFLSYSEVTVATRSGPYPDQMVDQHLEMTSATLIFRHIACLFTSVRKLPAIVMNEE